MLMSDLLDANKIPDLYLNFSTSQNPPLQICQSSPLGCFIRHVQVRMDLSIAEKFVVEEAALVGFLSALHMAEKYHFIFSPPMLACEDVGGAAHFNETCTTAHEEMVLMMRAFFSSKTAVKDLCLTAAPLPVLVQAMEAAVEWEASICMLRKIELDITVSNTDEDMIEEDETVDDMLHCVSRLQELTIHVTEENSRDGRLFNVRLPDHGFPDLRHCSLKNVSFDAEGFLNLVTTRAKSLKSLVLDDVSLEGKSWWTVFESMRESRLTSCKFGNLYDYSGVDNQNSWYFDQCYEGQPCNLEKLYSYLQGQCSLIDPNFLANDKSIRLFGPLARQFGLRY